MLTKSTPTFDSTQFGERNAAIMEYRRAQYLQELNLMLDVNNDWFDRMWETPDVAMCLGRYSVDYSPSLTN